MKSLTTPAPSLEDALPALPAGELESVDASHLQSFCLFIGYPRSGHTVIGSLLDAHPEIIVANELDVLNYFKPEVTPPVSREIVFSLLLQSSRAYAAGGCRMRGYSYAVPGQWQGRYRTLKVIGDKRGGVTSQRIAKDPGSLARLRDRVKLPVKFIHIYRNPFDNIATMSRREAISVVHAINIYFELANSVEKTKSVAGADAVFELSHEAFLRDPRRRLRDLCAFLGVNAPQDYLDACAAIVFESPNPSRETVVWEQRELDVINKHMQKFPFLREYAGEPVPEALPQRSAVPPKKGTVVHAWPEGEGPRVLVLLDPRHRDFESVLQVLKRLNARALVFDPGIPPALLKKYGSGSMHFSAQAIDVPAALRGCDLAISNGDPYPTAMAMSAAVPQLLLPMKKRQKVVARHTCAIDAGCAVLMSLTEMPPFYDEIIPLILKSADRFRAGARAYAAKVRAANPVTDAGDARPQAQKAAE